ncbi:hypothetical protein FGRMN_5643 [Fusarium graminum]|nr:hypothetical protein FGRMN_5643 [Fusarium graminum]
MATQSTLYQPFLTLPPELQELIWSFTLPDYQIHCIKIRVLSKTTWRQTIKSPVLPVALHVNAFSRATALRRLQPFVRHMRGRRKPLNAIEATLQYEPYWIHGTLPMGYFDPVTDFLHVATRYTDFPVNLEDAPFNNLSIHIEPEKGLQDGEKDDFVLPDWDVVALHRPLPDRVFLVLDWALIDKEHAQCNRTIPVGKPVAWKRPYDFEDFDGWKGYADVSVANLATRLKPRYEDRGGVIKHLSSDFPNWIVGTMPMACGCPGMVQAMIQKVAEVKDKTVYERASSTLDLSPRGYAAADGEWMPTLTTRIQPVIHGIP